MVRTRVYIDGFNLYYGAVRRTPYRWLNVARMCEHLLPGREIVGYKYFTALVKPRPSDLDKRRRQRVFMRALKTIPTLEVILGHFLTHEKRLPLSSSPVESPRYVTAWVTEEKGSDVNLATHLLNDAHLDRFEDAVIVSNDSDLLLPIQVVMEQYGR